MSTNIDWDVASLTLDMIDQQWDDDRVDKPDRIELYTEDEDGNNRKRVRRTNEYIHVAEEQERGMEYTDVFWETANRSASCFVEFSTPESRERREEIFSEIERIAMSNRKRPDTPGGWDEVKVSGSVTDDENFGWWMGQFTFSYTRRKELID